MRHWLQTALDTYGAHPLHGNGYQWWSGEGSDLAELTIVAALVAHVKHRNCHHKGCWRTWPYVHLHPGHGWPSCRHHWNEVPAHVAS